MGASSRASLGLRTYSLRYAKASTKACRRQRPSAAQARASLSHRPMPPLPTVTPLPLYKIRVLGLIMITPGHTNRQLPGVTTPAGGARGQ